MSNITFVFPNRGNEIKRNNAGEITGFHKVNWAENPYLPLDNVLTTVLPDTARTTDFVWDNVNRTDNKRASFAMSLPAIPYRPIGAAALIGHNISISGKVRFIVYNEPALCYVNVAKTIVDSGSTTITIPTTIAAPASLIGKTLRLFGHSSNKSDTRTGDFIEGTVTAHDGSGLVTLNVTTANGVGQTYSFWYVGNSSNVEIKVVNIPAWENVWERVYDTNSSKAPFRSRNFWRGTIEPEEITGYTTLCVKFFERYSDSTAQPLGTHLHVDIDDSGNLPFYGDDINPYYEPFIEIGYVMFGKYFTPNLNATVDSFKDGMIDPSQSQSADGGQLYFHEKEKIRTVSMQFDLLSKDEAYNDVKEMQRMQGITRPVIYLFSKTKLDNFHYQQSFVGFLDGLNPIGMTSNTLYNTNISLREMK
jgi:hypothetical protein